MSCQETQPALGAYGASEHAHKHSIMAACSAMVSVSGTIHTNYSQTSMHTRVGGLTCDDAIVGRFQHGSIKLNDVLMTQDTKNLSLDKTGI